MTVVIHIFPNPPSTRELHPPFQLLPFASLRDFAWTLIVATGCVSARCRRHGLRRCFSLADTKFVHTCGRQSRPVFFLRVLTESPPPALLFPICSFNSFSSPTTFLFHFYLHHVFPVCLWGPHRCLPFLYHLWIRLLLCTFFSPPVLWVKYALVRQLWLRAISQTAVVLPEWMFCFAGARRSRRDSRFAPALPSCAASRYVFGCVFPSAVNLNNASAPF